MEKGSAVAALFVVILMLGAGVGVSLFSQNGTSVFSKEYTLTYELNGGENSPENPDNYVSGVGAELFAPYRSGYIFDGWYSDSGFTKEVKKIDASMRGDITLYAEWEKSLVGTSENYDVTGTIEKIQLMNSLTTNITGTMTNSYYGYSEAKGYLVQQDIFVEKRIMGVVNETIDDSERYWTNEVDDEYQWSISGTETLSTEFGDIECEVYVGTNGSESETQYIGIDDMTVYKVVYESFTGVFFERIVTQIEYNLKSISEAQAEENYTVKAYRDVNITVSGDGKYDTGSKVVLNAAETNGSEFKGWFDGDGNLLSRAHTYIIDSLYYDCGIYAMNTDDPDIEFEDKTVTLQTAVPLTNVKWTLTDGETKTIESGTLVYTFSESGLYRIDYEGTAEDGSLYCGTVNVVNGALKKTFEWSYKNKPYHTELYIKYSDYTSYRDNTISRGQGTSSHDLKFVTYDDPYVKTLANDLALQSSKLSDVERANFILCFVQYIEYTLDIDTKGVEEYWRFPVETLYEQTGDCEDTAILYSAIMKSLGYDTALLLFPGHMASSIDVDGCTGTYFAYGSKSYYYCETTTPGWKVGVIPPEYSRATIIPVI